MRAGGELVDVAAPEQGADAGEQFGQAEGLGHVVVGTGVEADHGVHLVRAGGEHQDGAALAVGAQATADLQAVHLGQAEVEDDEVDLLGQAAASAVGPSSRTSTS